MAEVAVLGAGNGGCATAGDLARRGHTVRLYGRPSDRLDALRARGGVEVTGVLGDGFAQLASITSDLAAAIDDADIVILTVPGPGLETYAEALIPLLATDQVVLLNPGHMGGGLLVAAVGARLGRTDLRLCETATLTYACRMRTPTEVAILGLSTNVLFAALPASATEELRRVVAPLFPETVAAGSVLETGLQDLNAVQHPPIALLNAGWIEHTEGDFYCYSEGTTPSVGRVIEAVDTERLALAAAAGVPTRTFVDSFHAAGFTTAAAGASGSVHQAMQQSESNRWIKSPPNLMHRYVHEDVGWGLVPWIHLGRVLGVATPTMEALTQIASIANEIDYLREGLTLERLGLVGLDAGGIQRYVGSGLR